MMTSARNLMDGTRISVFWPAEDFWFHGTVKSSADPKSKVKIHYDPIGEMPSSLEDLDEETQEWKILSREVSEEDRAFRAKKRKRVQSLRVGTRVSVLWGNEDCFFQGTIRKIKESSKSLDDGKPHFIEYDDGEIQWTNLYFCKFQTISPKMAHVQVGSRISFLVKDADSSGKSVYEDATVIKIANDLNYPHLLEFDGTRKKTYVVNLNVEDFHFLPDASASSLAATQQGDIPNKVKNAAQEETGASSPSKLKRKPSKPLSPRAVDKSLKISKAGVKNTEEGSKSSKKLFKQLKKRSKTGAKAPSASANKSLSNKFPKEFGEAPKKRQKRSLLEDSSSASPQQYRTEAPMYESFDEDPSKKRVFKIQQKSSDSILAAPESVKSSSLREPQHAMGGTDNNATGTITQAVKAKIAGVWSRVSSKISRVLKKRKQEFLQDLQETDIGLISSPGIVNEKEASLAKKRKLSTHGAEKEDGESKQIGEKLLRTAEEGQTAIDCENDRDSLKKRPSQSVAAQRQSSYAESSIAVDDQPAPEGQKEAADKGPEPMNGQDTWSKRPTRRVAAERQSSYAEPSITADDQPAPVRESGTVGKTEPAPFHVKKDPNEYYIEEEAHLYHNPPLPSDSTVGVLPCDLAPLPPPPPPPSPMPRTGNCNWAYDEANRVFTADFRNHGGPIDPIDEDFMLKVMERDDLTLISDGLLDPHGLEPDLWTMENIVGTYGDDFFHKFRRFDTVFDEKGGAIVLEKDSLYSMRMTDYWFYLQKREEVLDGVENDDSKFCFKDHLGKDHDIDVQKSALYCIDLDMKKSLTEIYDDFLRNFRMASILPGGKHCLMNKVTEDARPFMGPNLYITPPGTFTHFHQDGHGTVDSGHLALSGYNEICILRRLPERHKRHALWLLTGTKTEEKSARQTFFDGLYAEPHADGHGEKPAWPTRAQIEECRKMGYCPSLPILKKGQHIHINKGRLHAFRKMTLGNTHEEDCHREARMKLFATEQLVSEQLCVSVAWDWNFLGSTERGIHRELSSTLEAAILNRLRSVRSLAIPEFALLEAARHFAKPTLPTNLNVQLVPTAEKPPCQEDQYKTTVCRGILPVLRYVIKEHVAAIEAAGAYATGEAENHPDTYADPSLSAIDPRGSDGFSCKTCSMELSNVYFHCNGCENLLSKDFNICLACHSGKNYEIFSQMHPHQKKRHARLNHVGNMRFERSKRCPCKNGPVCDDCSFCLGCSCKCHARFTLHCRLHTKETELKILGRVEAKADLALSRNPCKYLDDAALTEQRFAMAKRSWGHIDDINPYS